MKSIALYLLVLVVATTGGYHLRDRTAPEHQGVAAEPPLRKPPTTAPEPWLEDALQEHSRDTIADLVGLQSSSRLPRMTLWLVDASSDEIRELWQALDEANDLDMRTYDLILIHWAEIDPRTAIAAAKASGHEGAAWWAWGHADPEHALQTALREAPRFADNVLRSIGQFHIDHAMRLMEQYPEALSSTSIEGIGAGLKRDDPGQAVEFLRTHGRSGYKELKAWAERDPDSALTWARTNLRSTGSSDLNALASELVIEHPERVPGWLQDLPTGGLRGALATEYVKQLADEDPEKALAFAQSQEGVQTRSELLATLGERLVHQDPGRSLALLREAVTDYQKGMEAIGTDTGGTGPFLPWSENLLATSPQEVMDAAAEVDADRRMGLAQSLMERWVGRDEASYANWLLTQDAGPMRDDGAELLVHQLLGRRGPNYGRPPDFQSALSWAGSISQDRQRKGHLRTVVHEWWRKDKDGAAAWFEDAPEGTTGKDLYDSLKKR